MKTLCCWRYFKWINLSNSSSTSGNIAKEGVCKSQRIRELAVRLVSPSNDVRHGPHKVLLLDCLRMRQTRKTSIDTPKWAGESPWGHETLQKELHTGKKWWEWEKWPSSGKNVPIRMVSPENVHTSNMTQVNRFYLEIHMYIHVGI